jgi:hypothetical protein
MATIGAVRRNVRKAYKRLKTWRAAGAEFEITGGMAYRIAVDGYEPKDPKIRVKLGLAAMVPAPVCEVCGEVHVSKRCTVRRKKPSKLFDMSKEALRKALEEREEL